MAAYAATVTLDWPRAERVGNSALGLIAGVCTLSNYNATKAEITTITKHFRTGGKLRPIADGISTNGYAIRWITASKAFGAYRVDQVDDPLEEAPDDTDIGSFGFVVVGQI